jgi:hypothetical protein
MMIEIATCKIAPPSAKAALLLVMWCYGAIPGLPYLSYRDALVQQYRTAGFKAPAANAAVMAIEECFRHDS